MIKNQKKKNNNLFLKIICGGGIITTIFCMIFIIGVLMILNFFGAKITVSTIDNNQEYSEMYKNVLNEHLKNGYVPLSRILYFYLENDSLSFNEIYLLNQDKISKTVKPIETVCEEEKLKNMVACSSSNIEENRIFIDIPTQYFNLPLELKYFSISSYYNHERTVLNTSSNHGGWDLKADAHVPVYSVCNGTVVNVNYTQDENIKYTESGNAVGNQIKIKCDDYGEEYYVIYAHLYPNSSKVKIGDIVGHWTEIASVGTTGYSTGNHLHFEVQDKDNQTVDGMMFVDMLYEKLESENDDKNNFGDRFNTDLKNEESYFDKQYD